MSKDTPLPFLVGVPVQRRRGLEDDRQLSPAAVPDALGGRGARGLADAARYTLPGIIAHESARQGGVRLKIPDLGDAPDA
ncbi:hypothetical protein ACF1GT_03365 [Streptomyces sp. NPDC014636]|uniref:hypothetical protein n=1 Tax=Streptomyces sp. NPDC014636 TaxID=3364876 RepID=UPI0036FB1093